MKRLEVGAAWLVVVVVVVVMGGWVGGRQKKKPPTQNEAFSIANGKVDDNMTIVL